MDSLPAELRREICFYVKHGPAKDISSLSLANRDWNHLARPYVYETLVLKFRDDKGDYWGKSLHDVVEEVKNDKLGRHFLKYARRLDVVCLNSPKLKNSKEKEIWKKKDLGMESLHDRKPATFDTFLDSHLTGPSSGSELRIPMNHLDKYTVGHWWKIESLMSRLERLDEINFIARNSFPAALTQAVGKFHPHCRLNIWSSQPVHLALLRRTVQVNLDMHWLDYRFDLDTLHSPSLHTLAVEFYSEPGFNHGRHLSDMLPAVFMAPNLKHLIINKSVQDPSNGFSVDAQNHQWRLLTATGPQSPRASLESLSFVRAGPWEDVLLKLGEVTDLCRLRSLDIGLSWNPALFVRATPMLPGLERLFVTLSRKPVGRQGIGVDDINAISAIRALNPLKFLTIRGLRSVSNLSLILEQHGESLRGLILEPYAQAHGLMEELDSGYIYPVFSALEINQLAEKCPEIQELRLQVKRSSPQECGLYKALGAFHKVHSLVLDLHCDPHSHRVFEAPTKIPELREAIMNAATDEKLVLGIWDLISTQQLSRRLRRMRVVPFGGDFFPPEEKQVLDYMCQSFLVTRSNSSECPKIEGIGREAWEWFLVARASVSREYHITKRVKELLADIWPPSPGKKNWKANWSSFPLRTEESPDN